MTTTEMTCALFTDRLMAYLERETDEPTRAALERHALACAECGALLADLRTLRIDAANLPELAPSRDLWSGIEKRIETPVVPITGEYAVATSVAHRRPSARRWMRPALMAAAVAGAAALGYFGGTRRPADAGTFTVAQKPETVTKAVPETLAVPVSTPAAVVASAPVTAVPRAQNVSARAASAPAPAVQAYTRLVADYDREIAKLRVLIDQRRNQMDPVTVAVIEKNLQVIDAAIAECKKAIARDPASRFLIESLNQSLQAKVELMRTAALLPSRT